MQRVISRWSAFGSCWAVSSSFTFRVLVGVALAAQYASRQWDRMKLMVIYSNKWMLPILFLRQLVWLSIIYYILKCTNFRSSMNILLWRYQEILQKRDEFYAVHRTSLLPWLQGLADSYCLDSIITNGKGVWLLKRSCGDIFVVIISAHRLNYSSSVSQFSCNASVHSRLFSYWLVTCKLS